MSALHTVRDHLRQRGLAVPKKLTAVIATIDASPPATHPRLLAAASYVLPAIAPLCPSISEALCPAFPLLPVGQQAACLALGALPTRVLRGLTHAEACAALRAGHTDPVGWLLREFGVPAGLTARTVPVARWLLACLADPERRAALERERTERGPGGAEITGRLLDRTDEISTRDLARGSATGVQAAFAAAAARLYAAWERQAVSSDAPLAPVPDWYRPIRCARPLTTAAQLIAEGRALGHCVGVYAAAVKKRECVIVSLCVRGERSTVELTRSGEVVQHRGAGNRAPSTLCERALAVCLRRWGVS